jgi:hypothetical protein
LAQLTRGLDNPLKLECLSSAQKGMVSEPGDVKGELVDFVARAGGVSVISERPTLSR